MQSRAWTSPTTATGATIRWWSSLANTGEVLSVVNRSGNRPSHEGAAAEVDRVLEVCLRGGFRKVLLRGDTDFTQTRHLDRWSADPRVRFIFGVDCTAESARFGRRFAGHSLENAGSVRRATR